MVVTHNLQGIHASNQINIVTNTHQKTTEQLSSGYRINNASDDACGLAISEKMRSQVRGLMRGSRNTEEGITLCQVADGALDEVTTMLQRIRELAVQSANGTNSAIDRNFLQDEVSDILSEVDRISSSTTFNNQALFVSDGSGSPISMLNMKSVANNNAPVAANDTTDKQDTKIKTQMAEASIDLQKKSAMVNALSDALDINDVQDNSDIEDTNKPDLNVPEESNNNQDSTNYGLKIFLDGDSLGLTQGHYEITTDMEKGVYLNDQLISWDQLVNEYGKSLAEEEPFQGTFEGNVNGLHLSIEVKEPTTLAHIAEELNGKSFDIAEDVTKQKAVSNIKLNANYEESVRGSKTSSDYSHTIYADEKGIRIDSGNTISWKNMGIDIDNPTAGEYSFQDKNILGMNKSGGFQFTIEEGATKESIINGLNNVSIEMKQLGYEQNSMNLYQTIFSVAYLNQNVDFYDGIKSMKIDSTSDSFLSNFYSSEGSADVFFSMNQDENGTPYLELIGNTPNSNDATYRFYATSESLADLEKIVTDPFDLYDGDNFFENLFAERKLEFVSNEVADTKITMTLELFDTFFHDPVTDFNGQNVIGFSTSNSTAKYQAVAAETKSIEEGNVGKVTKNAYVEGGQQVLVQQPKQAAIAAAPAAPNPVFRNPSGKDWWIQSGARRGDGMYVEIDDMDTSILGIDSIDISTREGALTAMDSVNGALDIIMTQRSKIGAEQNRLEHTYRNVTNIAENTQSSESRIRDMDMAKGIVQHSIEKILQLSSFSLLSQANQTHRDALALLT